MTESENPDSGPKDTAESSQAKKPNKLRVVVLVVILAAVSVYGLRRLYVDPPWQRSNVDAEASKAASADEVPTVSELTDWPQLFGPSRDASVRDVKIRTDWTKNPPKLLWSVEVTGGYGGAAIAGDQVFLFERKDSEFNVLSGFELESGKPLWSSKDKVAGRISYDGSRCVPTVLAKAVVCTDYFGHVYAFDRKQGTRLWKQALHKDFKFQAPRFGFSQSPLAVGEQLILGVFTKDVGVVSLSQKDGSVLWQSKGLGGAGYVSPILAKLAGKTQLVCVSTAGVSGLDPKDGRILWQSKDYVNGTPIPVPTVVDDQRLFITGGYGAGSLMLSVREKDGQFSAKTLFRIDKRGSQIHPAIFYQNHLYANFNRNGNIKRRPDGLVCMAIDGQVKWRTKAEPHIHRGPLLRIGDHLLTLGGEDGVLRLILADPAAYKELGSIQVFDKLKKRNNMIWAPMAFARGRLILRSMNRLSCFDLRPKAK